MQDEVLKAARELEGPDGWFEAIGEAIGEDEAAVDSSWRPNIPVLTMSDRQQVPLTTLLNPLSLSPYIDADLQGRLTSLRKGKESDLSTECRWHG